MGKVRERDEVLEKKEPALQFSVCVCVLSQCFLISASLLHSQFVALPGSHILIHNPACPQQIRTFVTMSGREYSSVAETKRLLDFVLGQVRIPADAEKIARNVRFSAARNLPYFPIPFKETELVAALKAIEGGVAGALAATKYGTAGENRVSVNLEKSTAFLIQAYLATVAGYGKLDREVKQYLKGEIVVTRLTPLSLSLSLYQNQTA